MLDVIESYINEINNGVTLDDLYKKILEKFNSDIEKKEIEFIMYEKFKYKPKIIESYEEKIKRKDRQFKEEVKLFYKTCVITGRSNKVCEVAHIFPFAESELDDKYNPNNGILLSADLHILFDKKLFMIDPETFTLCFTEEILYDDEFKDYHKYHNKKLNINKASIKYFEKLNK